MIHYTKKLSYNKNAGLACSYEGFGVPVLPLTTQMVKG
jgi:hypothetical protein